MERHGFCGVPESLKAAQDVFVGYASRFREALEPGFVFGPQTRLLD
jgi:hypothetical protein